VHPLARRCVRVYVYKAVVEDRGTGRAGRAKGGNSASEEFALRIKESRAPPATPGQTKSFYLSLSLSLCVCLSFHPTPVGKVGKILSYDPSARGNVTCVPENQIAKLINIFRLIRVGRKGNV